MTLKEMIDDLLKRGKIESNELVTMQLQLAMEKIEIEEKYKHKEHNSGVEVTLLNVCNKLEKIGNEMYRTMGTDSYVERCHNHDAKLLIYGLTNKSNIEKIAFIKWRDIVNGEICSTCHKIKNDICSNSFRLYK
jgi:hypothetical protein